MKKMRRLIPAIAMLLVSAVMLSTASFAWFTMNSEVEATGMTVQAKADGSMVIDTKPLTAASTGWEAQFAPLGNKKIAPVAYGTYRAASYATGDVVGDSNGIVINSTDSTGWYDAFDNKLVDSMTGESKYFKAATLGGNYVDYVVYVGLASESEVKNIKATLTTDSDLWIANAYAVAFYVDDDITSTENITATTEPDLILHCNTVTTETKVTGNLFDSAVTIPSTIGVGTDSDGVGIKITMRVYIDGNLKDGQTYVPKKATYKAAEGNYDPAVSYFVKSGDDYVNAVINENDYTNADGSYKAVSADWFVFNTYVDDTENARDKYFVSNANAPMAPSALDVSFELVD